MPMSGVAVGKGKCPKRGREEHFLFLESTLLERAICRKKNVVDMTNYQFAWSCAVQRYREQRNLTTERV